jgi:anti-sigma B factor antagonist
VTLDMKVEEKDQLALVTFSGELDISRAEEVERELQRIEGASPHTIVFDLRSLEFLDSTGLRLILGADSRARRDGRRLLVVPGPDAVQRVFRITLLDRRLDFVEEPPDAADGA